MSALSQLLDRLRSVSPPPGAAATVMAVPSAGDELSGEVAFLFGELGALQAHRETLLATARAQAAAIEDAAFAQRTRMLEQAREEARRHADELLAQRRASDERQAALVATAAELEAERILAHGRERTPALAAQVVARILEMDA